MFARAVNENETIKSALDDVILFSVDCEKGEGPAIAKKYGIRGYPTFVAMNGQGEVTDRWIGYEGPEAWAIDAKAAAADPRPIAAKKADYEAKPTVGLARRLANDAGTGSDYVAAAGYLRQARELDPAGSAKYTQDILMNMYYGAQGGAFTFDEVEAEAQQVLKAPDTTVQDQMQLAVMMRGMARGSDQPARAVPYIVAALKASEGSTEEGVLRARGSLQVDHALLVDKDPAKALTLFRATFAEGWLENPDKLNNFAWWCFENDVNLAEAEEMALKAVTLAENDGQRANILDTAAEICNKRGNCDEAIARIKQAIELSPDKQYFKDQLVRFEQIKQEKGNG